MLGREGFNVGNQVLTQSLERMEKWAVDRALEMTENSTALVHQGNYIDLSFQTTTITITTYSYLK